MKKRGFLHSFLFIAILIGVFLSIKIPFASSAEENYEIVSIPCPSLGTGGFKNNDTQDIHVFLPNGYSDRPLKNYPVIYLSQSFGDYGDLTVDMKYLYTKGVYDFISVIVSPNQFGMPILPFKNSPNTGNWEDFLALDVVPYIDENYRTIQRPSARGIVLYEIFYTAFSHSDVFGNIMCIDAFINNPQGEKPLLHEYRHYIDRVITIQNKIESKISSLTDEDEIMNVYKEVLAEHFYSHIYACTYGDRTNYYSTLLFGMGAVHSYNDSKPGIYMDFPYRMDGNVLVEIPEIKEKWDSNLMNLSESIAASKSYLSEINIGILYPESVGSSSLEFLIEGNEYLCQVLDENSITYKSTVYASTAVPLKFQNYVFPFFSTSLDSYENAPSQNQIPGFDLTFLLMISIGVGFMVEKQIRRNKSIRR